MPSTSLLTLATMFSQRFADYPAQFPHVHNGVTSAVFNQLQTPFDFVVGRCWYSAVVSVKLQLQRPCGRVAVGSGYAGSFMARQLASEFPCMRVLLLEAGGTRSID